MIPLSVSKRFTASVTVIGKDEPLSRCERIRKSVFFNGAASVFSGCRSFLKGFFIRSPLAWRLLMVNLLAPVLLVAGMFYMDHYQKGLIDGEIKFLKVQAELISVAVSEGAVASEFISSLLPLGQDRTEEDGFFHPRPFRETFLTDGSFGRSGDLLTRAPREVFRLDAFPARHILRRLASLNNVRVRLFDHNGVLTADSFQAGTPVSENKKSLSEDPFLWGRFFGAEKLPPYDEPENQTAFDYEEVGTALGDGVFAYQIRYKEGEGRILSAALPIIFNDQIIGAILVNGGVENVVQNLIAFRLAVLRLFTVAFIVTILLSFFMVRTIVTPLNKLSSAAVNIRVGGGRRRVIPDETARKDEIGDLSGALIKMTDALWERLDATERFAADVAHEIKNPLSSMRSAVETLDMISDPEKKQRLMDIIREDILRLDRLITDISNLSRLDAELSREEFEPVDIRSLLSSMIEVYNIGKDATERGLRFVLDWRKGTPEKLCVLGMETRLAQVFYNLIGNAISFSPDGGTIRVSVRLKNKNAVLEFEDEGPGIPPGDEEKLFRRFYCERPAGEHFGHHSGLGLSISEKIVTGSGGSIYARNRKNKDGKVTGARLVVILPVTGKGD